MLGIIIGVGAVVGMVSLGQGATASVQREIASLGTNVLIIIPGATTTGGVRGGLGSVSTLTVDDARDIEKRVGDISLVTYASRSVLQVIHEHKNWNTIALGTTTTFTDLRNWPVADGIFLRRPMKMPLPKWSYWEERSQTIYSSEGRKSSAHRSESRTSRCG